MHTNRSSRSRRRVWVAVILVALCIPLTSQAAPGVPENYDESTAMQIEELPFTHTADNTLVPWVPIVMNSYGCGVAELWYRYTPSTDQRVQVSASGVQIYPSLTFRNDSYIEECSSGWEGDPASMTVRLTGGEDYYFLLGSSQLEQRGELTIEISELPPDPPPVNDLRAAAIPATSLPFYYNFNNSGATITPGETNCGIDKDIWFSYTPSTDQEVVASLTIDSAVLVVYEASQFPRYLVCDDVDYYQARARMGLAAGTTYLFQVGSRDEAGSGYFSLHDVTTGTVPNDDRSDAMNIPSLPFSHNQQTQSATVEPGESRICGRQSHTVWFAYSSPSDAKLLASTVGSLFSTSISVFDASDLDDHITCASGWNQREIEFAALAGHTYLIQVGGDWGDSGGLSFSLIAKGPVTDPVWASPEHAYIRPGMSFDTVSTSCSANFVFAGTGSRRGKVYIGTASHCTERDIGSPVWFTTSDTSYYTGDGAAERIMFGRIVYAAAVFSGALSEPCYVILSCGPDDAEAYNDFSLIEVLPEFADEVSPSMLHFGGPTGLATFDEIEAGQKVMAYGGSVMRPGPEQLDHHEGYVIGKEPRYRIDVKFYAVGIFGDSGSAVIRGDGKAVGVLVTVGVPATNGVSSLSEVMAYAHARGWMFDLATSPIIDAGIIPAIS